MLEKLRIKITIVATIIVTAYAYFSHKDFLKTCYTIILTIIIFYILGGFVEIFLQKQIDELYHKKQDEQNEQDESVFDDQDKLDEEFLTENDDTSENNENLNKDLDYIDENLDYLQNEE